MEIRSWPQVEQTTDVGFCVYAIFREDSLHYIGYTKRLKERMYTHGVTNAQGYPLQGITIRYLVTNDASTMEPKLIQQYQPIGNRLENGKIVECRCGNVWVARVPNPKACPRCKRRLDAPLTQSQGFDNR